MNPRATTDRAILNEFREIPGIGKSLAQDLYDLGFRSINELKNQNPEKMYDDFEKMVGAHADRCVLYVWRCAVYYARGGRDGEKLKWWNWKG